jgi:putative membrane protein
MPTHTHEVQPDHIQSISVWLPLLLLLVPLVVYLTAAGRQRRLHRKWSAWRDLSFASGIGLIALSLSTPVSEAAHGDLRRHMAQHLLIGMFAPTAMMMAAPVTLLLRTLSTGSGRTIASFLRSRPVHLLCHPVTALFLNIGGLYLLYLTPLYARSLEVPLLHGLVNIHFFTAGYLFTWSIAGPDPAPGRPGMATRVASLIAAIGLHAFLAKTMYANLLPQGVHSGAQQIREAAILMYYGGDVAELLLAVALFANWHLQRKRKRRRLPIAWPLASAGSARHSQ